MTKDSAWHYFSDDGFERMRKLLPGHVVVQPTVPPQISQTLHSPPPGLACYLLVDLGTPDRTLIDNLLDLANEYPHTFFCMAPVDFIISTQPTPALQAYRATGKEGYVLIRDSACVDVAAFVDHDIEPLAKALARYNTTRRPANLARREFVDKVKAVAAQVGSPINALRYLHRSNLPFSIYLRASEVRMCSRQPVPF